MFVNCICRKNLTNGIRLTWMFYQKTCIFPFFGLLISNNPKNKKKSPVHSTVQVAHFTECWIFMAWSLLMDCIIIYCGTISLEFKMAAKLPQSLCNGLKWIDQILVAYYTQIHTFFRKHKRTKKKSRRQFDPLHLINGNLSLYVTPS